MGKDKDDDHNDEKGKSNAWGSFFGNDIDWEAPEAERDKWYAITDEDLETGIATGVDHDGKGKLSVKRAGTYFVLYSMTAHTHLPGGRVQTGILINGSPDNAGIQHWSGETTVAGGTIVKLDKGDAVQVAVRATDSYRTTLHVEHLNCSVFSVA